MVGVGRFSDPHQADQALDEGHCDLIGVVRGQIADPDFAAKALAGQEDEIRTCLACNGASAPWAMPSGVGPD